MSVKYLTSPGLDRILLNVGPLCVCLISDLLSMAGSNHNCILPLAFGTGTKLLHHLDISSTSKDTIICCFCSKSSSSLSGSSCDYAKLLWGDCYGQLPSFTCNLNVPSKHQIPEKDITDFIVNSFHYLIIINTWLAPLSASLSMLDLK